MPSTMMKVMQEWKHVTHAAIDEWRAANQKQRCHMCEWIGIPDRPQVCGNWPNCYGQNCLSLMCPPHVCELCQWSGLPDYPDECPKCGKDTLRLLQVRREQ